ncbi:MAG: ketopantoate reductase family protein [Proteobacteria bacterium]|nr:ketopantoate reductase family protein [Pseudomonadota bacterium]
MENKPKIAVVGAGAVGGYFGGRLAEAGHDVCFLARGRHLDALRSNGLIIKSCKGDAAIDPVVATDNPDEIGECHIVLFCVKSFDTAETAEAIRPLVGNSTTVISLQNGIENEEVLGEILGKEKVMGAVTFIGSRISEPGVIMHTAAGNLSIGETDGSMSVRGDNICRLFESSGIEARLTENIKKAMWQKMVWNCGFNAITALTGCTASEVLVLDESRIAIESTMIEVITLAKKLGIELSEDLPGKMIAHSEGQGAIRTSMLIDMESGRPMEIEALNGTISRKAKALGLASPINDTLYGMISSVNKKRGF